MTLMTALLIMIIILFSVILIVLVTYLGPIFQELKLTLEETNKILKDTQVMTETVSHRVVQVDGALEKASSTMNFLTKAASNFNNKVQ